MAKDEYRNFMGYHWVLKEDNAYTIGINEEGLSQIDEINSIELPAEGEEVEAEVVVGTLETDDGQLDLYSPVSGKIVEINSAVLEDPNIIQEDPYDGWLFRVESEDELDEDEDEDDDSDNEDEDADADEEED